MKLLSVLFKCGKYYFVIESIVKDLSLSKKIFFLLQIWQPLPGIGSLISNANPIPFDGSRVSKGSPKPKSFDKMDLFDKKSKGTTYEKGGIDPVTGKVIMPKMTIHKEMYPCPHCEKIFKTRFGRDLHIMQHTGEYRYRCQYCQKPFGERNKLEKHLSNTHGHKDKSYS